jgi:hypothetical protein
MDLYIRLITTAIVSIPIGLFTYYYTCIYEGSTKETVLGTTPEKASSVKADDTLKAEKAGSSKPQATCQQGSSAKAYPRARVLPSLQLYSRAKLVYLEDISSWEVSLFLP